MLLTYCSQCIRSHADIFTSIANSVVWLDSFNLYPLRDTTILMMLALTQNIVFWKSLTKLPKQMSKVMGKVCKDKTKNLIIQAL